MGLVLLNKKFKFHDKVFLKEMAYWAIARGIKKGGEGEEEEGREEEKKEKTGLGAWSLNH